MVIVATVIAALAITGHGLDALMAALLASLLTGAYLTRRNIRAAVLYSHRIDGRRRSGANSNAANCAPRTGELVSVKAPMVSESPQHVGSGRVGSELKQLSSFSSEFGGLSVDGSTSVAG
jgi:hypothetical protein